MGESPRRWVTYPSASAAARPPVRVRIRSRLWCMPHHHLFRRARGSAVDTAVALESRPRQPNSVQLAGVTCAELPWLLTPTAGASLPGEAGLTSGSAPRAPCAGETPRAAE